MEKGQPDKHTPAGHTPAKYTPGGPAVSRPVRKVVGRCVSFEDDLVAAEEPLEIRVDGASFAVTMRTPGHDRELAVGFCLTEGIAEKPDDIERVETCSEAEFGNIIDVTLSPEARQSACGPGQVVGKSASAVKGKADARGMYLSSSCGLCGRQTIERVFQNVPRIENHFEVQASTLLTLPDMLREKQATFDKTGGLHGVALFSRSGELIVLREDIGRHNAVDKVIGHQALLNRYPVVCSRHDGDDHGPAVLLVSGRAGFEIVQKAGIAGIGLVAAVGAPSSLAVDACARLGITLVGFLRPGRMNIYHEPERARIVV